MGFSLCVMRIALGESLCDITGGRGVLHFWGKSDILWVRFWIAQRLDEVVYVNHVKRENERTGVCDYGQAGFFKDISGADGGRSYA